MIGEALAAAAHALGDDAAAVLARVGGSLGDDARVAATALAGVDDRARKVRRAEWAARARAPTPEGLRAVHPTWIEAALEPLPGAARAAVAHGGGDDLDTWLARWAMARLAPMPVASRVGRPRDLDEALGLPAADLASWLASVGRDQLAFALGESSERDLGPRRAAIARCAGLAVDATLEWRVGARAIGPHVARRALALRQLMQRLPRSVGLVVADELRAHAATPVDECPTWTALAAG